MSRWREPDTHMSHVTSIPKQLSHPDLSRSKSATKVNPVSKTSPLARARVVATRDRFIVNNDQSDQLVRSPSWWRDGDATLGKFPYPACITADDEKIPISLFRALNTGERATTVTVQSAVLFAFLAFGGK